MRRQVRGILRKTVNLAALSQSHGFYFLFNNLLMDFKNNLKTCGGGVGKMRRLRTKTGQSTLEYVVVLTAIIAAITLAVPKIKQAVQNAFEHAADEMETQVEKIEY